MKLPIYLAIEEDTVWTTYKSELQVVNTTDELKAFVKRWQNLLTSVTEDTIKDSTLAKIKAETLNDEDTNLIAELIIPVKVVKAMILAKEYVVPLNCAFIQMNGGLGEFEE